MSTIVIKYDGNDITDDVVFSRTTFRSNADGAVGTAEVVIDDPRHVYPTGSFYQGRTLELIVDGVRQWDGWVFKVARTWPFSYDDTSNPSNVPRFWRLTGQDRNLLFTKRIVFRQGYPTDNRGLKVWPAGTTDKEALEYAIEHYLDLAGDDLTFDIDHVGSPGPYEEFTLGFVSAPMGALFEDCAQITGAVFFINPGRRLKYVDDMTVTAPAVLSDTPSGSQVGFREFEIISDYTQCANEALVWGTGKGSDEATFVKYTNDTSVKNRGLWQWGEIFYGAWKDATVRRRAKTYVEGSKYHQRGHGDPVPGVTCTIFEPGFRAGDVVDFRSAIYDWQQALPIRQMTMTFPTPSLVRYDLEMSLKIDTPFGAPNTYRFRIPKIGTDPPDIPDPHVGGGSNTTSEICQLIDHFDFHGGSTGIRTVYQESPPSSIHLVNLPDGISVGDTVFVFIGTGTTYGNVPAPGFTRAYPNGFIEAGWNDEGIWDHDFVNLMLFWRVIDGTEMFYGSGDKMVVWLRDGTGEDAASVESSLVAVAGLTKGTFVLGDMQYATETEPAYVVAPTSTHEGRKVYFAACRRGGQIGEVTGRVLDSQTHEDRVWYAPHVQTKREGELPAFAFASKTQELDLGLYYPLPVYFESPYGVNNPNGGALTISAVVELPPASNDQQLMLTPPDWWTLAPWVGGNPYRSTPENGTDNYGVNAYNEAQSLEWGVEGTEFWVWGGTTSPSSPPPFVEAYLVGPLTAVKPSGGMDAGAVLISEPWGPWEGMVEGDHNGILDLLIKWRCDSRGDTLNGDNQHLEVEWSAFRENDDGTYVRAKTAVRVHLDTTPYTSIENDTTYTSEYSGYVAGAVSNAVATPLDKASASSLPVASYVPNEWMNTRIRFDASAPWTKTTVYTEIAWAAAGKGWYWKLDPGEVTEHPEYHADYHYFYKSYNHLGNESPVGSLYEGLPYPSYLLGNVGTGWGGGNIPWTYRPEWSPCTGHSYTFYGGRTHETWYWINVLDHVPSGCPPGTVVMPDEATHLRLTVETGYPYGKVGNTVELRYLHDLPTGLKQGKICGQRTFVTGLEHIEALIPTSDLEIGGGIWLGITQREHFVKGIVACGMTDFSVIQIPTKTWLYGHGNDTLEIPSAVTYRHWGQPKWVIVDDDWLASGGYTAGTVKAKTWRSGDDEPTDGTVECVSPSGTFTWYGTTEVYTQSHETDPGWDIDGPMILAPFPEETGFASQSLKVKMLPSNSKAYASAGNPANRWGIDKICVYAPSSTTVTWDGMGVDTPTETPVSDATTKSETGTYVTRYPYQPNTLVVYKDGILLRRGIDYIELDPASGTFALVGSADYSSGLTTQYTISSTDSAITTEYIRSGSDDAVSGGAVYRPEGVLQWGWGTTLDPYNSVMACSAMALDRHTSGEHTSFVGQPRSTPPVHRSMQANLTHVNDITEVESAWLTGWQERLEMVGNTTWARFSDLIDERRGAILMGRYEDMPGEMRVNEWITGRHAVFVNERFVNGNFLAYDPLYPYPRVYTEAQLQTFALGYPAPGLVRAAFTRAT